MNELEGETKAGGKKKKDKKGKSKPKEDEDLDKLLEDMDST